MESLNFGCFLRAARTSMDITQEEMAKKLGVSKSMICDIEKGRQLVSPKMAIKIAKVSQLSEQQALSLCFQDQVNKLKLKMKVQVAA
ncbi:MAG: helix-turn-helix transcriptional regulator [Bacteriovoracales bacterium]|nr:helix-turn-helix transcriptional regulator [Bacteriovoracales bacterium]